MKADLAKLRALEGRLRVAAATEANDDYSKPLTPQRGRMVARFDAMVEAADAINELLAIAEAVERDAKDARRYRVLRDPIINAWEPQPAAWIEFRGNEHIESDWLTGENADAEIDRLLAIGEDG